MQLVFTGIQERAARKESTHRAEAGVGAAGAFVERMIESNPRIMMGKPVVSGTRITVESILERLGAGESVDDLVNAHPRLNKEAIEAALQFAAEALRADVVYPAPDEAA